MARTFTDWDSRPAVLFDELGTEALALLRPGGAWEPVDAFDVFETAAVLPSEEALKARFASTFGAFEVPKSFSNEGWPAGARPGSQG